MKDIEKKWIEIKKDLPGKVSKLLKFRSEAWDDTSERDTAWLDAEGGGSLGIWVPRDQDVKNQLWILAPQVQDFVQEILWSNGESVSWPLCPESGHRHPLSVVRGDGDAPTWACPQSATEYAAVGSLLRG